MGNTGQKVARTRDSTKRRQSRSPTASRRHGEELDGALLDAAWQVLVENGYSGFTYEAVASQASTSRPVLYRRWPRREDMLVATLTRYWKPMPVPDTGSLRTDVLEFLNKVNLGRADIVTLIGAQLMDFFRETGSSFNQLRDSLKGPDRPDPLEIIIGRAIERGELENVARSSRLLHLPFDLLRHDMLMTLRPLSPEAITEIVDEIWLPLLRSSEPARPARRAGRRSRRSEPATSDARYRRSRTTEK